MHLLRANLGHADPLKGADLLVQPIPPCNPFAEQGLVPDKGGGFLRLQLLDPERPIDQQSRQSPERGRVSDVKATCLLPPPSALRRDTAMRFLRSSFLLSQPLMIHQARRASGNGFPFAMCIAFIW